MFNHTFLKAQRIRKKLSEAELAARAGISRLTLRSLESGRGNPTWDSIAVYARELGFDAHLVLVPQQSESRSEDSTLGVSFLVLENGFDTWPLFVMNFVDNFRKTGDARLIALAPVSNSPRKLTALLASTVLFLCAETGTEEPDWVKKDYFLDAPWFPSETESLKAMALLESPVFFRKNNIFVLENFLQRA